MYYRERVESYRPNIWSDIDPLKVKQRIDTITAQLEGVRRKFDPQIQADNSFAHQKR